MRRQKRDKTERAYTKGYRNGLSGRSKESCPHDELNQRQAWLTGWRKGWSDHVDGYTGVSGIQASNQHHF